MCQTVKCSTPNKTREEDSTEETKVDSDEAETVSWPQNAIATIGRRWGTLLGIFAEGGAILSDQATKTTWSNGGTMENSATMKRSVERRNESQLQPTDNSRTMPRISIMTTMAECS